MKKNLNILLLLKIGPFKLIFAIIFLELGTPSAITNCFFYVLLEKLSKALIIIKKINNALKKPRVLKKILKNNIFLKIS